MSTPGPLPPAAVSTLYTPGLVGRWAWAYRGLQRSPGGRPAGCFSFQQVGFGSCFGQSTPRRPLAFPPSFSFPNSTKALNLLAFAAATALTLSTSSCSKKEQVNPAQPEAAAAASTDALASGSYVVSATGFKGISNSFRLTAAHNVTIRATPRGGSAEVKSLGRFTAGNKGVDIQVSKTGPYTVTLLLDGRVADSKSVTVR